jgi:hypothetical protein
MFIHRWSYWRLKHHYNTPQNDTLHCEGLSRIFPNLVFIVFIDPPRKVSDDEEEEEECEMKMNFQVHLYGEITPMELVIESCMRSQDSLPSGTEWEAFLDQWDGKPEGTASHYNLVRSITIHEGGRFLTNDKYPVESLQDKHSQTDPFQWTVERFNTNCWKETYPILDIRHLPKDDAGWVETLQGCMWLMQTNDRWRPGAAVRCRSDMVVPLLRTVSLEPFALHQNAKDLTVST